VFTTSVTFLLPPRQTSGFSVEVESQAPQVVVALNV